MSYEYKSIVVEKKDGIAVVTLNEPKTLNSLIQSMFDDLAVAAVELDKDDEVKVVVLTGAGKAFCAGGDLNRFKEGFDMVSGVDYVDNIHPFIKNWFDMRKPTIAAVNGAATGAGMSLALLCDMAIASDKAKIGCAFINMALVPDCALAWVLPRVIGVQKAKELIYTGRLVGAEEAEKIGLFNCVVPAESLMDEVMKLAGRLAKGPSYAIRMCKRIINMGLDMDLNNLLSLESVIQTGCLCSEDSSEAVNAFLGKRAPVFKGR